MDRETIIIIIIIAAIGVYMWHIIGVVASKQLKEAVSGKDLAAQMFVMGPLTVLLFLLLLFFSLFGLDVENHA
jgi:hypothetical protein